jgi:hypothetical protein
LPARLKCVTTFPSSVGIGVPVQLGVSNAYPVYQQLVHGAAAGRNSSQRP